MVDDLFLNTPVFSYNGGNNEGPEVCTRGRREGGGGAVIRMGRSFPPLFPCFYVEVVDALALNIGCLADFANISFTCEFIMFFSWILRRPIRRNPSGFCPPQIKASIVCDMIFCFQRVFFRGKVLV